MPNRTKAKKNGTAGRAAAAPCRVGLAFGGGLPFGLVAFGVRQAFEEAGIPVTRLAGTSLGAIIAATWALDIPVDVSLQSFKDAFSRKKMVAGLLRDLSFSRSGILRGEEVQRMLESFIGKGRTFEDASKPLRIPACDLTDGTEVVFESGSLVAAIRASISLPGIFTPFHHDGRVLVDGALIRPIPIHLLGDDEVDLKIPIRAVRKSSGDQLSRDLASARKRHRLSSLRSPGDENIFAVLWRSLSLIMQDEFDEIIFDEFVVYIKPELDLELSRDPSRIDEIVQAGYEETRRMLPRIRRAIQQCARKNRRIRKARR
jgi:NTE family protein